MLVNSISRAGAVGSPVLVLMHGRGADATDLEPVANALNPGGTIALLQAPFPGAPWGYGGGWAWYRFLGETRPDPAHYATSEAAVLEFLGTLPSLLDRAPGPVVLGGFSQGGTMSLGLALRNPGAVAGVLNLSGFLPDVPGLDVSGAAGQEVFWGHGTADPAVPFANAVAGREALRRAGARVTAFDHPGGHTITLDELAAARAWMARLATPAGEPS